MVHNYYYIFLQVGNLANDGHKLGRHLSACSKERASEQFASSNGCNCWKFGGPTGPFLHIIIAFCLMLPKLLMQARFIEAGFFPQGKKIFYSPI